MSTLDKARRGYQTARGTAPLAKGYGGGYGVNVGSSGTVEARSWSAEAGLRYDNSVVFAAVQYGIRTMLEVDLEVCRTKRNGDVEVVKNHEALRVVKEPNPWYSYEAMVSGWVISQFCAAQGSSYTFKHRSGAGKVIALEYIPHFGIWPYIDPGSPEWISWYWLTVSGGYRRIEPGDVIQQRYGPIDPARPQLSVGPLNAAMLEVATDKQAAMYTASILSNVGVTPHLITPKGEGAYNSTQALEIKEMMYDKISGGNRGKPLVASVSMDVHDISMSPTDMDLSAIRQLSETRICSALGIHPLSLNLGVALENSNNRASAEAAAKSDARNFGKPFLTRNAAELTRGLMPELGEPGEYFRFRIEDIEALKEDSTEAAKRDDILVRSTTTVNELRASRGDPALPGGDVILGTNIGIDGQRQLEAEQAETQKDVKE